MKKRWILAGAAGVVAAAIAVTSLWLRDALYRDAPVVDQPPVVVEISSGSSLRRVAAQLQESGLLERAWYLRAAHRLEGGGTVKAGVYELREGSSPVALLRKLVAGEVATIAITVPEGWVIDRICSAFSDSLGIDGDAMLGLCQSPPPELAATVGLEPGLSLEGYLFPETYRFARGVSEREVIEAMLDGFTAAFDDSLRARATGQGFSVHETVTLASIIEAETRVPGERAKVAAVYRNRLDKGWRLEADPTVAYGAGIGGEELTYGHLEADTPYNTYRRKGLPPGPINNPGRAALVAALWPEDGFAAMYFVADGEGGHVFSRTWQEHRRAVQEYRRKQGRR